MRQAYLYHGTYGLTGDMLRSLPGILEAYPYAVEFTEAMPMMPSIEWQNEHLRLQTYWSEHDMMPNHHYEQKGHLYSMWQPFMFVNNSDDYKALLTLPNVACAKPFVPLVGQLEPVESRTGSFWRWVGQIGR